MSRLHTKLADPDAARVTVHQARQVLEPLGSSRALAACYLTLSGQDALTARNETAMAWAERALAVAGGTGCTDIVARALCSRGMAKMALGDETGPADLERAVSIAEAAGHGECVAVVSHNLSVAALRSGRPEWADRSLEIADRAAREHDLDVMRFAIDAQRGHLLLWRGEWDLAQRQLQALLDRAADPGANLVMPLAYLGRLLARRGDSRAAGLVDRAWALAAATGERQRIAVAGGARIELAWLAGEPAAVRAVADELLGLTGGAGHEVLRGEVLRYLRRIGVAAEPFPGCPPALAAGLADDWAGAAKLWVEAGNPYEQALELTEAPEPPVLGQGLALLDRLGAAPAAALVRRRLRAAGVRGIPRGPGAAAKANPARLTARQVDVLALLAEGRTNAEIAAELYLSRRTVDNHVAALLAKLGARSRRDAVAKAAGLGLLRTGRK